MAEEKNIGFKDLSLFLKIAIIGGFINMVVYAIIFAIEFFKTFFL